MVGSTCAPPPVSCAECRCLDFTPDVCFVCCLLLVSCSQQQAQCCTSISHCIQADLSAHSWETDQFVVSQDTEGTSKAVQSRLCCKCLICGVLVMQTAQVLWKEDARKDASWPRMRGPENAQSILLQRCNGAPTSFVQQ